MEVLKHIFLYLALYNVVQYQCLRNIDYYGQKQLHHLFPLAICSNRHLNYNFQYEHFPIVNTLNDVLSGIRREGSLDANDLAVHQFSYLNILYFDGKF